MNPNQQRKYLDSVYPEIQQAISEEYPPDKIFINVKYVSQRIKNNPTDYPKLSIKSEKHIRECIAAYFMYEKGTKCWSNGSNHNVGRIFVREVVDVVS